MINPYEPPKSFLSIADNRKHSRKFAFLLASLYLLVCISLFGLKLTSYIRDPDLFHSDPAGIFAPTFAYCCVVTTSYFAGQRLSKSISDPEGITFLPILYSSFAVACALGISFFLIMLWGHFFHALPIGLAIFVPLPVFIAFSPIALLAHWLFSKIFIKVFSLRA